MKSRCTWTDRPSGEEMAPPFMKLPNKACTSRVIPPTCSLTPAQRSFPDYYETIKHPMCLEMVDKKLQAKGYETLKGVVTDLGQIFTNAKRCKSLPPPLPALPS